MDERLDHNKKKSICNVCNKKFSQKSNLNTHMRTHTGLKPYICTFPNCFKRFNASGNFKCHLKLHMDEKDYKCEECDKRFVSEYRLKVHKKRHSNFKPYFCPFCNKGFFERANLKIHERVHTDERPFICDYLKCNSKFKTFAHLKDHKQRHFNNHETLHKIENNSFNFFIGKDSEKFHNINKEYFPTICGNNNNNLNTEQNLYDNILDFNLNFGDQDKDNTISEES